MERGEAGIDRDPTLERTNVGPSVARRSASSSRATPRDVAPSHEIKKPEIRQAVAHSPPLLQFRIEDPEPWRSANRQRLRRSRRPSSPLLACAFATRRRSAVRLATLRASSAWAIARSIFGSEGLDGAQTREQVGTNSFVTGASCQAETFVQRRRTPNGLLPCTAALRTQGSPRQEPSGISEASFNSERNSAVPSLTRVGQ